MGAKAKKARMCSVRIIVIELKGLAAPGQALKITTSHGAHIVEAKYLRGVGDGRNRALKTSNKSQASCCMRGRGSGIRKIAGR